MDFINQFFAKTLTTPSPRCSKDVVKALAPKDIDKPCTVVYCRDGIGDGIIYYDAGLTIRGNDNFNLMIGEIVREIVDCAKEDKFYNDEKIMCTFHQNQYFRWEHPHPFYGQKLFITPEILPSGEKIYRARYPHVPATKSRFLFLIYSLLFTKEKELCIKI